MLCLHSPEPRHRAVHIHKYTPLTLPKLFKEDLLITSERLQVILEIPSTSFSPFRKSSVLQHIEL